MTRRPKPTMHGRDHAPDGPDPIPDLGGSGFTPVGQQWNPNGTAVAAAAITPLDFGTPSGTVLTSAPNAHTLMLLEDGVYSFMCSVRGVSLTAAAGFTVQLLAMVTEYTSAVAVAGVTNTWAGGTIVSVGVATTTIQVVVENHDSASRNFYLENCYLQKIAAYP